MQQVNSPALKLFSCVSSTAWPHAKVAVSRTSRSYVVLLGSIIESFGGDAVQSPPGFQVVVVMVKVVVVEAAGTSPSADQHHHRLHLRRGRCSCLVGQQAAAHMLGWQTFRVYITKKRA